MGFLNIVKGLGSALASPLRVLEGWATEPLKRWENERDQANKDRDVERKIRQETGKEKALSQIRRQEAQEASELRRIEAEENANLQIRMQTEVNRINAETEQWTKDQEFKRMKAVADAVIEYKMKLTELQTNTISTVASMSIELRAKAQELILTKTQEYRAIQDKAVKDAEAEFERIESKFAGNERIYNIMITASQEKLSSAIKSTSKFLEALSEDIQNLNKSIDQITQSGQKFIDGQLNQFNSLSSNSTQVLEIGNDEQKRLS